MECAWLGSELCSVIGWHLFCLEDKAPGNIIHAYGVKEF